MKLRIIQLFITAFAFIGCEYDVETYSGGSGIYFENNMMSDTVGFSWANYADTVKNLDIKIRIMTIGKAVDYDRTVKLSSVNHFKEKDQAVVGVDYKPFSYDAVIPSGASFTDLTINLMRNPELLNGAPKIFTFRLEENEHFKFYYNRAYELERVEESGDTVKYNKYIDTYRTFKISEKIARQGWWYFTSDVGYKNLGLWSIKKSILICDLMKIDRGVWLSGNLVEPITSPYIKYLGRYMHRWLQENPTYEDDGTLMEMGEDAKRQ